MAAAMIEAAGSNTSTDDRFANCSYNMVSRSSICLRKARTLAVRELTERHTGAYISSVVREVLAEYKVSLKQVYLLNLRTKNILWWYVNELHFSEWQSISNLVGVLKPAKITTKCIQTEQLTAGDIYDLWLKSDQTIGSVHPAYTVWKWCICGSVVSWCEKSIISDRESSRDGVNTPVLHLGRHPKLSSFSTENGAERATSSSSEDEVGE